MRAPNKKATAPARETSGLSKSRKQKSTRMSLLSPRQLRTIRALLQADRTTLQIDRIAPCTNSAMIVKVLRDRFGLTIPCIRVPFTTIDGVRSWYGKYSLTAGDRGKLRRILSPL